MRKVLKNTSRVRAYIQSLPTIYMVGCWARCGVWSLPFTGKYTTNKDGLSVPLVYVYDDHNGTCDNYYLRGIDRVTSGAVIMWTQNEKLAHQIAEFFNRENGYE